MRLGDFDALKKVLKEKFDDFIPEGVYDEIDNAPTIKTYCYFERRCGTIMSKERPFEDITTDSQGDITNDDIQQAIKEGFANGYEMAKSKYERPQGKWIFHKDYNESCRYGCNQCGNLNNIPGNFCPNCGADMKKGGAE